MKITLLASIPANVARRYGWAIRHHARESGERPTFVLSLTPPAEVGVSFTSKIAQDEPTALRVRFFKTKLRAGRKSRAYGLDSDPLAGWQVGMDQHDARLAGEFIEKYYG